MNAKEIWKKFWYLLWKDNSLKGWIFSLIVLFIFVKFIFFPGLSFISGTELPLAIVESCSMHHSAFPLIGFNSWWNNHDSKYNQLGFDKEKFDNFPLKNGFTKGDILFIMGVKPENVKLGDVIIFKPNSESSKLTPIIHRVISIRTENGKYIFSTIGDNNAYSFEKNNNPYKLDEITIEEEQIVGRAVFRLAPYAGWAKLIFFEPFKPQEERGFCKLN